MIGPVLTWWVICGFIGCAIAATRGQSKGTGLIMGVMLGPVGWILLMFDRGPTIGYVLMIGSAILIVIGAKVTFDQSRAAQQAEDAAEARKQAQRTEAAIPEARTAGAPTPAPSRTPTPQEIQAAAAQRARAQAEVIARKYK